MSLFNFNYLKAKFVAWWCNCAHKVRRYPIAIEHTPLVMNRQTTPRLIKLVNANLHFMKLLSTDRQSIVNVTITGQCKMQIAVYSPADITTVPTDGGQLLGFNLIQRRLPDAVGGIYAPYVSELKVKSGGIYVRGDAKPLFYYHDYLDPSTYNALVVDSNLFNGDIAHV